MAHDLALLGIEAGGGDDLSGAEAGLVQGLAGMDGGGHRDALAEQDAADLVDQDVAGIELDGAAAEHLLDDVVLALDAEPPADGVDRFLIVEPLGEATAVGIEADAEALALAIEP